MYACVRVCIVDSSSEGKVRYVYNADAGMFPCVISIVYGYQYRNVRSAVDSLLAWLIKCLLSCLIDWSVTCLIVLLIICICFFSWLYIYLFVCLIIFLLDWLITYFRFEWIHYIWNIFDKMFVCSHSTHRKPFTPITIGLF